MLFNKTLFSCLVKATFITTLLSLVELLINDNKRLKRANIIFFFLSKVSYFVPKVPSLYDMLKGAPTSNILVAFSR